MIILISFFLEGVFSNYISHSTFFFPLFTLVSFILAATTYKEETLIKMSLIIGLLYDIVYTNTLGLHMLLFYIIVNFILFINKKIKINIFNIIFLCISIILIYLILSYFILLLLGYLEFEFNIILYSIKSCFLINIIYLISLYSIKEIYHIRKR